MRTITLRNDFHNRIVEVRVPELPALLTRAQCKRVNRVLCGHRDCSCGGVRGPQYQDSIGRLEVTVDGLTDGLIWRDTYRIAAR